VQTRREESVIVYTRRAQPAIGYTWHCYVVLGEIKMKKIYLTLPDKAEIEHQSNSEKL
jgi:hypothetical protein